jgi:hypothetical protein
MDTAILTMVVQLSRMSGVAIKDWILWDINMSKRAARTTLARNSCHIGIQLPLCSRGGC